LIRRRFTEYGRNHIGCDPEAPHTETLYALTDFAGITLGRRPMPFNVGPHNALNGQRLTVGPDLAE
jgi:hypothetical protein